MVTERVRPGVVHSYASSAKYDPLSPGKADSSDKGGCVEHAHARRACFRKNVAGHDAQFVPHRNREMGGLSNMTRLSMLIDVTRCSGCYNCFLACRDEYYGNDYPGYSAAQPLNDQFWMQVKEIERGELPAAQARLHRRSLPALRGRSLHRRRHRTGRCTAATTASSSSTR